MKLKKRLDIVVSELYPQYSRNQIQSWIMQGKVTVDDIAVTKAGAQITDGQQVVLTHEPPRYVCRAGFKLEKALTHFALDVSGLVALDAGLSTGGFTDCLLQNGVQKVFGIDVGYGQVHEKIRTDTRVTVMERTNLRHVESVGELVDIVTLDLSFISILKVLDAVKLMLKPNGILITLIKPQFEGERSDIGKGGIIKDPLVHERIVATVKAGIESAGFVCKGITESPITGTCGNKEFLAYFYYAKSPETSQA